MDSSSSSSSHTSVVDVVVVDVQYFLNGIVKEIGLFRNGTNIGLSYQPPYSIHRLSRDEQNQCRWVTKNLHKIQWNEGTRPYNELPCALKLINSSFSPFQSDVLLPPSCFERSSSSSSSSPTTTTSDISSSSSSSVTYPSYNTIYYAKGAEKCRVLENIFNKPFIDLDSLGCPRAEELIKLTPQSPFEVHCSSFPFRHHMYKHDICGNGGISNNNHNNNKNKERSSISHCAQRNAKLYGEWIRSTFLI